MFKQICVNKTDKKSYIKVFSTQPVKNDGFTVLFGGIIVNWIIFFLNLNILKGETG